MNLKIISKSQVQSMIDAEIRKSETRLMKIIDKLRRRILELEINAPKKKIKLVSKNSKKLWED